MPKDEVEIPAETAFDRLSERIAADPGQNNFRCLVEDASGVIEEKSILEAIFREREAREITDNEANSLLTLLIYTAKPAKQKFGILEILKLSSLVDIDGKKLVSPKELELLACSLLDTADLTIYERELASIGIYSQALQPSRRWLPATIPPPPEKPEQEPVDTYDQLLRAIDNSAENNFYCSIDIEGHSKEKPIMEAIFREYHAGKINTGDAFWLAGKLIEAINLSGNEMAVLELTNLENAVDARGQPVINDTDLGVVYSLAYKNIEEYSAGKEVIERIKAYEGALKKLNVVLLKLTAIKAALKEAGAGGDNSAAEAAALSIIAKGSSASEPLDAVTTPEPEVAGTFWNLGDAIAMDDRNEFSCSIIFTNELKTTDYDAEIGKRAEAQLIAKKLAEIRRKTRNVIFIYAATALALGLALHPNELSDEPTNKRAKDPVSTTEPPTLIIEPDEPPETNSIPSTGWEPPARSDQKPFLAPLDTPEVINAKNGTLPISTTTTDNSSRLNKKATIRVWENAGYKVTTDIDENGDEFFTLTDQKGTHFIVIPESFSPGQLTIEVNRLIE